MTQRSIHHSKAITAPTTAPAPALDRGSAALTTGLLILVALITVLTGAGFGYV